VAGAIIGVAAEAVTGALLHAVFRARR